ncbi:NAD(P)H-dependent oxidoreductase [Pseudomonas sp. B22129]|uniref:NAD(P)H-dependent oxidoreductase n=1 Tax=Pseudomonas sp. B22129 TaxID=3235111 RepID=UPI003783F258
MNKSLLEGVSGVQPVEVVDLYERYRHATFAGLPDTLLAEDRLKLADASAIVLQFPFYWYSMPSLLKQWLDDVLLNGWAHHGGVEGKHYALAGKPLLVALTTGGAQRSYGPAGYNMHWLSDFMPAFVQTARTCKMHFVEPFYVHADTFDPVATPREYLLRVLSLNK